MIDHIDHLVVTTRDLQGCLHFYCDVLGMQLEQFVAADGGTRVAVKFGAQKFNIHEWGKEFEPRAHVAAPGTLDICLLASVTLEEVIAKFKESNVPIILGPVMRTGATSPIRSVYVRDPDLNLVEISVTRAPPE